jgi:nicotinamide-nucleotide amidase
MRIEILCTGDEILTGKTINTNYSHMAQRLLDVGLEVQWGTVVGDDRGALLLAFRQAAARAEAVIVNGGLGPTVDDLSQEIAAEAAGVDLVLDEAWLARMEAFWRARNREMPPNNRKQALLPRGAEFIDNPIGTACGFAVTIDGARFFFTPGVPREMRRMLDEQIIPRLLAMGGAPGVARLKRFHSFGIGESRADDMLKGVETLAPPGAAVKLGFQAHYPELETKIALRAPDAATAEAILAPIVAEVRRRLGTFILCEDDATLESVVIESLRARGGRLAIAETFTGGGIAARIGAVPGSEAVFRRAVVARDLGQLCDAARLMGVSAGTPLTTALAAELAETLRADSGATHAVAVLIALDPGAETSREVGGAILIGLADAAGTITREARFVGGREWVRLGGAELALDVLRRRLLGLPTDEQVDFERR